MSDLAILSLQRAGLPRFAGATMPDQLVAGRDAALGVLRKYEPGLTFDPAAARTILQQIAVWEERNNASLGSALADPGASTLPEQIRLAFGADKARQFILAVFTEAAKGLGPWTSGAVAREAQTGAIIAPRWAEEDAESRLQVFGAIVKMDQDGYLQKLWVPPPTGTQGLGLPVAPILVWAIVVTLVSVAGLILLYLYNAKRLEQNNKLMATLCENAQKQGDAATVAECVKATAGLQQQGMFQGLDDLMRAFGKLVLYGGLAYVGIKFALPMLLERAGRSSPARRTHAQR
jgi:hypothetical protein